MGTVLRPVYDNNTTLDSFRDAAQLYDGQLLTFYEARLLCLCLGVDLQPIYETFLFKDSRGGCTRIMMEHLLYKRSCKPCQTSNSFFQGVTCAL